MNKNLYLHVGMPKCASSTIQDSLAANAEAMRTKGKVFALAPGDHTTTQGNATKLVLDLQAGKDARTWKAVDFFASHDADVILSSEVLVGMARHAHAGTMLEKFAAKGFTPRIICYVRRQDEWIESDYKQHVKGGTDWTGDIEELIEKRVNTKVLDYHWMLSNWARYVDRDRIEVVALRPGQGNTFALERFYDFIGLPGFLPEATVRGASNVSPPASVIEAARYVKMSLLEQGLPRRMLTGKVAEFIAFAVENMQVPAARHLLSAQRRAELVAQYADSNAALAADFMGGTQAFEPFTADPEEDPPLDPETTLRFLAACIAAGMPGSPFEVAREKGRALARKALGRQE